MKRCPNCQRTYSDLSLSFCMDDGTPLTSEFLHSGPDAETLKLGRGYDTTRIVASQADIVGLEVIVQLEGKGKQIFRNNQFAGTRHQGRGLEGFQLRRDPPVEGISLKYMGHLAGIGDKFAKEGQWLGANKGESCRVEGFGVELTGPLADRYDVYYMAHIQGLGDTAVFKNGEFCGTRERGLRVEGIQVDVRSKARLSEDAATLKIPPKRPEMVVQDIIMEIADYLRRNVSPGELQLIRFELLTGLGISITQISDNFLAAAEKADCEVADKTDTRANVSRRPARLVRA